MHEGLHQHLADLGIGVNQGVHLMGSQLGGVARLTGSNSRHRGPAEERAHLAVELPWAGRRDHEIAEQGRADRFDLARPHDEGRHVRFAALGEDLTTFIWPDDSMRGSLRDLRGPECRNISDEVAAVVSGMGRFTSFDIVERQRVAALGAPGHELQASIDQRLVLELASPSRRATKVLVELRGR